MQSLMSTDISEESQRSQKLFKAVWIHKQNCHPLNRLQISYNSIYIPRPTYCPHIYCLDISSTFPQYFGKRKFYFSNKKSGRKRVFEDQISKQNHIIAVNQRLPEKGIIEKSLHNILFPLLLLYDLPSRTAFATSVASARVGLKLLVILSTTRVTTAGLPAMLHL